MLTPYFYLGHFLKYIKCLSQSEETKFGIQGCLRDYSLKRKVLEMGKMQKVGPPELQIKVPLTTLTKHWTVLEQGEAH